MRCIVVFCAMTLGSVSAASAEQGLASYYGDPTGVGLTAAHRSLPMGSEARIVDLDNGRAVIVRIVDRGPFIDGRIIDVSPAVATTLGFKTAGLAHVRVDRIAAATPAVQPAAAWAAGSASPQRICAYGAGRLEYVESGSAVDFAGGARRALGCVDLRSIIFVFAKSEDLTPIVARAAYLTELEAAASIPGAALETAPPRKAAFARAASGANEAALAAAASIPGSAVDAALERAASSARAAHGCSAPKSCETRGRPSASSIVLSFFARLHTLFD